MCKAARIIIADDNREYCEMFAKHCESMKNVEVVAVAYDGEEAIQAILEFKPDIVIIDIILSYIDGLGVMEKINSLNFEKKPKFIVVSALAIDRVTQMCVKLGAEYFFVKPCEFGLIIQRTLELCGHIDYRNNQITPAVSQLRPESKFKKPDSIEGEVTMAIQRIGIPPHIRGYQYVRDAIVMVIDDISLLKAVTTQLYPEIAKKHDTMPTRVERAMRHAIEVAWIRGDMETIQEFFGLTVSADKGKPTNSEFIAMVADRIKLSM